MRTRTFRAQASANEAAGFTLVEVLVVLVIISVGLGMVAFSVAARPADYALQKEAEALANWIRAATSAAAERAETHILRYDLDGGSLVVQARGVADEAPREVLMHRIAPPVRIERVVRGGGGVRTSEAGQAEAVVSRQGTCDPHLVVLTQKDGACRTLEVNPITGDVSISPGRVDYAQVDPRKLLEASDGE